MEKMGGDKGYFPMHGGSNYKTRRAVPEAGKAVSDNYFISQLMQYILIGGAGMMY